MSDRIAVFNAGSHRAGRRRRPRSTSDPATAFVAGFVGTSNLLSGGPAQTAARRSRARSPSGPRRSGSGSRATPRATARSARAGTIRDVQLPRRRHPLPRRARRRRASSSSIARTSPSTSSRRAHRPRPPGACSIFRREHARPVGWRPQAPEPSEPSPQGGRTMKKTARGPASASSVVLARRQRRPRRAASARRARRQGRRQGQHPRLAGLRGGRLDRQGRRLGHAVREEDRLQGVGRRRSAPPTRRSSSSTTGQYDVVSASGDSSLRSIVNGDAAPINTEAGRRTTTTSPPFLKEQAWNSYEGKIYGVPHGWGANLLMCNEDVVHAGARRRGASSSTGARRTRARSPRTTTRSTSPTPRCT